MVYFKWVTYTQFHIKLMKMKWEMKSVRPSLVNNLIRVFCIGFVLMPLSLRANGMAVESHSVATQSKPQKKKKEAKIDNKVYVLADSMPQFDGGTVALTKYLDQQLNYPEEAITKKIEGKVTVQFVVNQDGSLSDPVVIRSLEPLFDKEAVRAIMGMPNWKPGVHKGKVVRVIYTLPVSFQLSEADISKIPAIKDSIKARYDKIVDVEDLEF